MTKTYDLHILREIPLVSPGRLKRTLPMTDTAIQTVVESRRRINSIIAREDDRLLLISGPCSIHDYDAALEYAHLLKELHDRFADRLFVVMRVYFEKPRTTLGWRGLITDPHLDGSYDIATGLSLARKILLEVTSSGLPTATEVLDPIVPQYLADLVSWSAIGARTTESQIHRDMASGLSMPVGFKNNTDGNVQIAIDAMSSARQPHSFLGIDQEGNTCILNTTGNPHTHVILRGSRNRANYRYRDILDATGSLEAAGFNPAIMVDCSHGNSKKQQINQELVLKSVLKSRRAGLRSTIGIMLESNLHEGNQSIPEDKSKLRYGVSITDECVGWEKTEQLIGMAYEAMR